METAKFETGKKYATTLITDCTIALSFEVVRRTAKTVWIKDERGETRRRGIKTEDGAEWIFPMGAAAHSPRLHADDNAAEVIAKAGQYAKERAEWFQKQYGE